MGTLPTHARALDTTAAIDGVWLTDREPGELLGVRRVVVYVRDSDPVVVAELPTRQEATELAEHIVALVDAAVAKAAWVELGDRLVRPDAIVSIDVEHAE